MAKLLEADDYIANLVIILFLLINFNLEIGTIYGFMAMIDIIAYFMALRTGAFSLIPIEQKKGGRWTSLIWAMGLYVVFIYAIGVITTNLGVVGATSGFEEISKLIAGTFSATPILFGSKYLKLAVWGILIPIVETKFFFRTLMQWGLHAAGMKKLGGAFTWRSFMVANFFGALFAVFHLVAKGIQNNSSLFITYVFGTLSVMMVIYFKQVIEALFLHIITNTIATMQALSIGFFKTSVPGINQEGVIVLLSVILISWLLLFQEIPFVKPNGVGI